MKIIVLLLYLVLIEIHFCFPQINNKVVDSNSIDSVYINKEQLIIISSSKKFYFENIVVRNSTLVSRCGTSNTFFLEYNFNASVTKSRNIVKLLWKSNKLYLLKEINLRLQDQKLVDLAWIVYYHNEEYVDLENYGSLITYTIQEDPQCKNVIDFKSTITHMVEKVCGNERSRKIPTFFKDGNFIGYYENPQSSKREMYSNFITCASMKFIPNISLNNINLSNDIAYFLEQQQAYHESVSLLTVIIQKNPHRTVAYINLGDSYWGLKETDKAKEAYRIYIDLMKKSGKGAKIPQRVLERVK